MASLVDFKMSVTPELPREAHEQFESFVESESLPPKVVFAADTALEELLQNLVSHSGAHEVRLQMSVEAGSSESTFPTTAIRSTRLILLNRILPSRWRSGRSGGWGYFWPSE